ncbi:MAG: hypothetical protein ACFFCZ_13180 [Promethearchaeota archaeon]
MKEINVLPHTKISRAFLLGLLYDIVNTSFLFNAAFEKAKGTKHAGWINFTSFAIGRHHIVAMASHGPYELKRGRYNSDVVPRLSKITNPDILSGVHYSHDNFRRMIIQFNIDTKSKMPLRDLGPYDRKNLAKHFHSLRGEGIFHWLRLNSIKLLSLFIALFFGLLVALSVILMETLGLFPILAEPFFSIGLLKDISIYDLLGPTGAVVVAYYAGIFFYRNLESPLLSTFEKGFSNRLLHTLPFRDAERFDFEYSRTDERRVEEIAEDFMKRSFVFERKKTTPYYMEADRVTHIEETFRIGIKKRHQMILHYIGQTRKGNLIHKLKPRLGYFAERFLEANLKGLGHRYEVWLKEERYIHIAKYNLKFNFPTLKLVVSNGEGVLQPEFNTEGKYVIEGTIVNNPQFLKEVQRKEKGIHTKSLVKGDTFRLIFEPEEKIWEFEID